MEDRQEEEDERNIALQLAEMPVTDAQDATMGQERASGAGAWQLPGCAGGMARTGMAGATIEGGGATMLSAAERWARGLEAWAIPPEILAAAPESPWGFPEGIFTRRADAAPAEPSPSTRPALEMLPEGGIVLDVGCGAGAASLPLAVRAAHLIGVDPSPGLLRAFRIRIEAQGRQVTTIEGSWPEVAERTPDADIVVCHHVAYNVPDLAPFLRTLTAHGRRRVVLEMTALHPMSVLNDLWLHFHSLARPVGPTADDVVAVLEEIGLAPHRLEWDAPALGWDGPTARADLMAWVRRRLCLSAVRDAEIADILAPHLVQERNSLRLPPRRVVSLWWDGEAPGSE